MSPAKILIVEDEIITAETIADQLERLGYAVADTVSSGEAALESISRHQPDLVLMDIVLKRKSMDGIAAAANIRDRFQLPVIYLTAHSDRATLNRARVTAPFGYILKPFNEQDLRIAIDMALFKSQAERNLTEQAAFTSTVLRSTDDAIATADADGAITYLNPAAEALTGWSLSEALGRAIRDVATISDEDAFDTAPDSVEHPAEVALRDRKVAYLGERKVLVRRDGSRIPVGDSASPMFADDGTLKGVVMILWDTRDRRAAEQLKQEVAERQQIEADLQDILKAERQLNEQKSRFITTVSHDYRTPLTSIRTATALLDQFSAQLSDAQRRTYLARIQAAVQQMTQLIDEVLTFERVEGGRLACDPRELEIESFCCRVLDDMQLLVGERHALAFSFQGSSETARLDEQLLRFILSNLIGNAVKYSPAGGTVSLRASCDGATAEFVVRDEGIGIPASDIGKVFESFFRGSNVGAVSGTGMGLSIVRKCVELHQGQLELDSVEGEGTTITIALPASSQQAS